MDFLRNDYIQFIINVRRLRTYGADGKHQWCGSLTPNIWCFFYSHATLKRKDYIVIQTKI